MSDNNRTETVCTAAILARPPRIITFDYLGQPRVVEPHALFHSRKGGELTLLAYQVHGRNNSDRQPPCWGNFQLRYMINASLGDETFPGPEPDYRPRQLPGVIHSL